MNPAIPRGLRESRWWETRSFAVFAVLLSIVPLLGPAFPPLTDLPGHIGRYHIAANLSHSPELQRHWAYHWALVGNLGVDLLVAPLVPWLGAPLAAKLVVAAIPPLTIAGLIWLSREGQGRLSPAAPFAFPLVYGYPFQFGFVNFALATALVILALALWLRLGGRGALVTRTLLFVPISIVLWLAHNFGWGMFGLFAFAAETARLREAGLEWRHALLRAAIAAAGLALPAAFVVAQGMPGEGGIGIHYDLLAKFSWIGALLRERWRWYDTICAFVLLCPLWTAIRSPRLAFASPVAAAGAIGVIAWLLLPYALIGAYADMRVLPYAVAVLIVAIRLRSEDDRWAPRIALAATGFFAMRMVTTTIALLQLAQGQAAALRIVDAIPRGAAVLVLVRSECTGWSDGRLGHIADIAIVRRDIFDNSEWEIAGQQLLQSRHPAAGHFEGDPSQLVYPATCKYRPTVFDAAIHDFDRGSFDHVWTIGFPARPALAPDVLLQASDGVSTLYRVDPKHAKPRLPAPLPPH